MTEEWLKLLERLPQQEEYYPRVFTWMLGRYEPNFEQKRVLVLKWRHGRDLEDFLLWVDRYRSSREVRLLTADQLRRAGPGGYNGRKHPFGDPDWFHAAHYSDGVLFPSAKGTALHWRVPDRHIDFTRGHIAEESTDFDKWLAEIRETLDRIKGTETGKIFRHNEMTEDMKELGRWRISTGQMYLPGEAHDYYLDVDLNPADEYQQIKLTMFVLRWA